MKQIAKQLVLIVILSLLYVTQEAYSQVIQTVVGNHASGGTYSGDGGLALSAGLSGQLGLTFYNGNLYIADTYNSKVRVATSGGGSGSYISSILPSQNGYFTSPVGMAFDSNGYIYVGDADQSGILEFQNWGSGPIHIGSGSFAALNLTRDSSGNLYFCDEWANYVRKIDTGHNVTILAGNGQQGYSGDGGSATSAKLYVDDYFFPSGHATVTSGVAVDGQGNVYVADIGNNRVRKVSGGIINTVAGTGTAGYSGDGGAATSAQLKHPAALAVDTQGNLYIADSGNNVVRRVDHVTGIITTVAGTGTAGYSGDSGAAINATLFSPAGLAFDASGNLYISDTGNDVVRKVTYSTVTISTSSYVSSSWGTTSGGGTKTNSSTVTVTATPASGYSFVNWTEGDESIPEWIDPFQGEYFGDVLLGFIFGTVVSTNASYTFTANGNRTLVAHFARNCSGSYSLLVGDSNLDSADVTDQDGNEVKDQDGNPVYYGEVPGDTGVIKTFMVVPGQHYFFNGYNGSYVYHTDFYPSKNYAYIDLLGGNGTNLPYYDGDDEICY